jgi:hypothetical protein
MLFMNLCRPHLTSVVGANFVVTSFVILVQRKYKKIVKKYNKWLVENSRKNQDKGKIYPIACSLSSSNHTLFHLVVLRLDMS